MAIGNEAIIQLMNNVKAPYNVNKLTAEVALSALQNLDLYSSNVKTLLSERDYLREQLSTIAPISKIHPSDANFLLFVIPRALEIYKIMADKGIVCRYRYYRQ
jgi:histidinol-phosphate aminotransferase